MGFGEDRKHQNHWNHHQKHLLLKLLLVAASEEQQHCAQAETSFALQRLATTSGNGLNYQNQ